MKYLLIVTLCCSSSALHAQKLYKCRANGIAAYKTTPCLNGEEQSEVKEVRSKNEEKKAAENNSSGIEGLEIGSLSVKVEPIDSMGDQWFIYKADFTNKTDYPMEIFTRFNAVDSTGFLITEVFLKGKIAAHSTETLTDKSYLNSAKFGKVSKWVLIKN
jgi:hypothetical protein